MNNQLTRWGILFTIMLCSTMAISADSISHEHGGREHSHPLPVSGLDHQHGSQKAASGSADQSYKSAEMVVFGRLFDKFCSFATDTEAKNAIRNSDILTKSIEFEGTSVFTYRDVEYGITPPEGYLENNCTVDVPFLSGGQPFFRLESMIEYMQKEMGYEIHSQKKGVYPDDGGDEDDNTKVELVYFKKKSNPGMSVYIMYPLEDFDIFYISLSNSYGNP